MEPIASMPGKDTLSIDNDNQYIYDTFEEVNGLEDTFSDSPKVHSRKHNIKRKTDSPFESERDSDYSVRKVTDESQESDFSTKPKNRAQTRVERSSDSEMDPYNYPQNRSLSKPSNRIRRAPIQNSDEFFSPSEDSEASFNDERDEDFVASDFRLSSDSESEFPDDSSDEDWGKPKRKAKKKPTPKLKKPARTVNSAKKKRYSFDSSEDSEYVSRPRSTGRKSRPQRQSGRSFASRSATRNEYSSESDEFGSDASRTKPVRSSARNVSQFNYNEDQYSFSDHSSDSFEKSKAKNRPKMVQPLIDEPGTEDIIEVVKDFRLKENAESDNINDVQNLEFFVKWKGWSYGHATWELFDVLSSFKGFKKVENFFKTVVMQEYNLVNDPEVSQESIEQMYINKEISSNILKEFLLPERIVAERPSQDPSDEPGAVEYLVKWRRQPYSACTWEPSEEISTEYPELTDSFLDRSNFSTSAFKSANIGRSRPPFKRILTQPEYLKGGELRDYQLTSLNWMANLWSKNENGILADEMGLGKTVQTISFIAYLFHYMKIYGPFLVVVPLSTIGNWQREFAKWVPEINVIAYIDDSRSRSILREYEFWADPMRKEKVKFNVVLSTYEIVLKDRDALGEIKWSFMAVDEAHRLKNSGSQLHEALSSFKVANRLLVTGTPLQNSVKELISLCRFLMPDKFSDYDADVDIKTAVGDPEQTRKISELHTKLKPYMLRRLKKDVEKSLPLKTERILRVELSPLQVHYYKNILTRNFSVLNRGVTGPGQLSLLNIMMELKKVSNHPFLFPNAEVIANNTHDQLRSIIANSGKMLLLDKLLSRLHQGGHRVLIFSQMVRMLDILSDYLVYKSYPFQRLDGSIPSEERKKSIEHFNMPGSPDFCFILSTRAGGLGINLETADTVIIFDSDWNPQNDLQAMARVHRIGQKKQVSVYRFVSKGTVEEDILERAKRKMVLEYCIIKGMDTSGLNLDSASRKQITQKLEMGESSVNSVGQTSFSKEELAAILKFGAKNMFSESNDSQKTLDEMDLDKMLADAEQTETIASGAAEDFLSQFQVADIDGSAFGIDSEMGWNEIVPEEERRLLEEQEKANLEDELAWSTTRGRRRKRIVYTDDGVKQMEGDDDSYLNSEEESTNSKKRTAASGISGVSRRRTNTQSDPLSLTDKEVRNLVRSMLRFGDIKLRQDKILLDADLLDKDADKIVELHNDIMSKCTDAIQKAADTNNNIQDNATTLDDELSDEKGVTKGDPAKRPTSKNTIILFRNTIQINATVLTQRIPDLGVLFNKLSAANLQSNLMKFRLGVPLKPVKNWSAQWGQRDDSALLVGIYKHGFGNWEDIQNDKELGLETKIFLTAADEAKVTSRPNKKEKAVQKPSSRMAAATKSGKHQTNSSSIAPKPTHLSRRAEYLLKVITEMEEKKSANASQPRLAKSRHTPSSKSGSAGQSSRSSGRSRSRPTAQEPKQGEDSDFASEREAKKLKVEQNNQVADVEEGEVSEYSSMDEDDCRELLRPVQPFLKKLKEGADKCETNERKIKLIRSCLLPVGRHIRSVTERRLSQSNDKSYRDSVLKLLKHLWVYAAYHWNRPVSHKQLMKLFEKLEASNSNLTVSSGNSFGSSDMANQSPKSHNKTRSRKSISGNSYSGNYKQSKSSSAAYSHTSSTRGAPKKHYAQAPNNGTPSGTNDSLPSSGRHISSVKLRLNPDIYKNHPGYKSPDSNSPNPIAAKTVSPSRSTKGKNNHSQNDTPSSPSFKNTQTSYEPSTSKIKQIRLGLKTASPHNSYDIYKKDNAPRTPKASDHEFKSDDDSFMESSSLSSSPY